MQNRAVRMLALAAISAHWSGTGAAIGQSTEKSPATYSNDATSLRVFHHENVLGTSLELKVRTNNISGARDAEKAALAEIDRCALILSAWNANSEFSRWAKSRGTTMSISPELMDVLYLFDAWRSQTDGALDASAETAVQLWRNASEAGRIPTDQELTTAVRMMQSPHWRLNRTAGTAVHLDDAPLALNSFVKSYIAGRAAEAAIAAGASGVLLNLGGDLVLRGLMTERVAIADPNADAENDRPLDLLRVCDRAVATSGSYRRGVSVGHSRFSHILDPRTGRPVMHVLSATVLAPDASEAGALATAFSVMQPDESEALAAKLQHVDYLLVLANGEQRMSPGWHSYQLPRITQTSYIPKVASVQPQMDLTITFELARISDPRYRRPYVSVWVEDKDRFPVKTIALWFDKARWLPDLKNWYHDDQIRSLAEGTDLSTTISAATRPPGKYTLRWDGKDNAGKPVRPGRYTICIEVAREHGSHQIVQHELDFDGKTVSQVTLPGNDELAGATLDYGVHAK
jgi:thiamine biosynthesis lipoprotein